jgi:hypothetical protein
VTACQFAGRSASYRCLADPADRRGRPSSVPARLAREWTGAPAARLGEQRPPPAAPGHAKAARGEPPLSPPFRTRRLLALTLRDLRRLAAGQIPPTPETGRAACTAASRCCPGCRRRRPRDAGTRKVERSRAGLDRTRGRKARIAAAGAKPEEGSIRLTRHSSTSRRWAGEILVSRGNTHAGRTIPPI